jgi:hypothetical protein
MAFDVMKPLPMISEDLMSAGEGFVSGIEKLGLSPAAVFWIYDPEVEELRLALVADVLNIADFSQFHRLLIKAYERSALPRAIDPLMVETFDRDSWFAVSMRTNMPQFEASPVVGMVKFQYTRADTGEVVEQPVDPSSGTSFFQLGPYWVSPQWVYRADWRGRSPTDLRREYAAFERSVRALPRAA